MEITRELTGAYTAEIHLRLDPEDYKPELDQKIKEAARQAQIPGFRPGKVPTGVIRRMMGKAVMVDLLNSKVPKLLDEYIKAEALETLASPLPKKMLEEDDLDAAGDAPLSVSFEVALAPHIELNYAFEAPPFYQIVLTEPEAREEFERYRKAFGPTSNPEAVRKGDSVYGAFAEADENGQPAEGGRRIVAGLQVDNADPRVWEWIEGAAPDEYRPFDPALHLPEASAEALRQSFFLSEEDAAEVMGGRWLLHVRRITRSEPAELNEEFFAKVADRKGFELPENPNEENVIEALRSKTEENLNRDTREWFRNHLYADFLDHQQVELPDAFLRRWLERQTQEEKVEDFEKELGDTRRSVIWDLVSRKLESEAPETNFDFNEFKNEIIASYRASALRYGYRVSDEEAEQYFMSRMRDEKSVYQDMAMARNRRLLDYIAEKMAPVPQHVNVEEFNERAKAYNDQVQMRQAAQAAPPEAAAEA